MINYNFTILSNLLIYHFYFSKKISNLKICTKNTVHIKYFKTTKNNKKNFDSFKKSNYPRQINAMNLIYTSMSYTSRLTKKKNIVQTFQNLAKFSAKASIYKHLFLINSSSLSTLKLDLSILLHDYYHSMKNTKNVFALIQTLSPNHMLLLRTCQNITFSSKYSQNTAGLKS